MAQLDIYIIFELVWIILFFMIICYCFKVRNLILDNYSDLKSRQIKFLVEKSFIKKIWDEDACIDDSIYINKWVILTKKNE